MDNPEEEESSAHALAPYDPMLAAVLRSQVRRLLVAGLPAQLVQVGFPASIDRAVPTGNEIQRRLWHAHAVCAVMDLLGDLELDGC